MPFNSAFRLLRIDHWVKNGFVLAPAFFAGKFLPNWETLLLGFIAFSLMASAVYIFNDWRDQLLDQRIPTKNNEFAKGGMKPSKGLAIAGILALIAVSLSYQFTGWYWLVIYGVWNVLYSLKMKDLPYVEMMFVVSGFLMRLQFGGELCGIPITPWLYVETILLTSLIILSKRIKEMYEFENRGLLGRTVLKVYSAKTLRYLFIGASISLLFVYTFYCFDPNTRDRLGTKTWITLPFSILGTYRFLQMTLLSRGHVNPVNLLYQDGWMLSIIVGWIAAWVYVMYG